MQISIIVFGQLTDIMKDGPFLMHNVADTDQLIRLLQERFPALTQAQYNIAVDKQIITGNTALADNNTVALLPPYAGG